MPKARKYKIVRPRWPAWTLYRVGGRAPAVIVYPQAAAVVAARAGQPPSLLTRELDETNNWARTAFQLYFGWFAIHFTVNAFAVGLLFGDKGLNPAYANAVLSMFIGWNLMGFIGTLFVYKGLNDSDLRIRAIVKELTERDPEAKRFEPRSPMPQQTLNAVLVACAITVLMSLAFWAIRLADRLGR